jgi:hypothetical protein
MVKPTHTNLATLEALVYPTAPKDSDKKNLEQTKDRIDQSIQNVNTQNHELKQAPILSVMTRGQVEKDLPSNNLKKAATALDGTLQSTYTATKSKSATYDAQNETKHENDVQSPRSPRR